MLRFGCDSLPPALGSTAKIPVRYPTLRKHLGLDRDHIIAYLVERPCVFRHMQMAWDKATSLCAYCKLQEHLKPVAVQEAKALILATTKKAIDLGQFVHFLRSRAGVHPILLDHYANMTTLAGHPLYRKLSLSLYHSIGLRWQLWAHGICVLLVNKA
ncbi:uncharacterized protein PFL1_00977 [Pseudozyma flocculosa PF-1]|uniref:uncharacterized protein n=1 Tax=Pseudozyma flocculosa PF-1 TaxID=1277687 RepID=UPI0004561A22|nr:uncharacterized protein PFL1_00977 [Pseudozyma flocculosa PF-1]EPQ31644.1 hypothetical protein PFL1_00977 [Pseudozyma flocculosa PF-1]